MTVQALWLLGKLKKAQKYKDAHFGIDFDAKRVKTMDVDDTDANAVDISHYCNSIHTTLMYLKNQGYIECNDYGIGRVLHGGWHWKQIIFSKLCRFLFRSILVPIFVAFVTALITVWVTR